ncbi:MAG: thiamine pyrophosphate-binding protein [Thermomicrobia bacterium]|nr:thiamine pyrophosphate-binding protein [Thermomicrobia bacterium]
MTGGHAVVATLEANGVDTVFGIPGVHTLDIYDALYSSRIRHILTRHEQGAGFMADGYARASGKPGVAIIITGPGLTNVSTPVGQAYADSSPVLIISAEVERENATRMRGNLHDLHDQLGLMSHLTKWNTQVNDVADIPWAINEALRQMRTGRPRPTQVQIPIDVLAEAAAVEITASPEGIRRRPDQEAIAAAAAVIQSAKKVVIYAGGGAVQSGVDGALTELAEALGAPVITSTPGKGAIPEDHPLAFGVVFYGWSATIEELLHESDVCIIVGSKMGAQSTNHWALPLPKRIIHIDIDPLELGRNYPAEVKVQGDARLAVEMLLDEVRASGGPTQRWERADLAQRRATAKAPREADYDAYIDALRTALPRDGIITHDMTSLSYLCHQRFPVYEPRTYFSPHGFGTLGFSMPAAIGAKIGAPEREVVAVVGDGGYQFTMEELAVAIQHDVTLPIVIFNDSTYTAVKRGMDTSGRYLGVDLVNPDYVKLADAYGIPGVRAQSADALAEAIREAQKRLGPTIIDTPIASPGAPKERKKA